MRIRPADPDRDAAACADIYAPFVRDSVISFEERVPTATEFAARMRTITKTHPWLVAEDSGEIAGYAYATHHRERAAYRWATDVAAYVAEGHRRRGVGRALYTTLLELLAAQGFRIACAGITLPNEASVGLHEALGFKPVGVYRRIGWKLGQWHDVGWWQVELRSQDGSTPDEPGSPAPPSA